MDANDMLLKLSDSYQPTPEQGLYELCKLLKERGWSLERIVREVEAEWDKQANS